MSSEIDESSLTDRLNKVVVSTIDTLMEIVDELKDNSKKGAFLFNIIIGISTGLTYQLARACDKNPYEVKQDILDKISRSVDATIDLNAEKQSGDSIH